MLVVCLWRYLAGIHRVETEIRVLKEYRIDRDVEFLSVGLQGAVAALAVAARCLLLGSGSRPVLRPLKSLQSTPGKSITNLCAILVITAFDLVVSNPVMLACLTPNHTRVISLLDVEFFTAGTFPHERYITQFHHLKTSINPVRGILPTRHRQQSASMGTYALSALIESILYP